MSNKNLSSSPERGSFRSKRLKESLESDDDKARDRAEQLQDFYQTWMQGKREMEQDSDWSKKQPRVRPKVHRLDVDQGP